MIFMYVIAKKLFGGDQSNVPFDFSLFC